MPDITSEKLSGLLRNSASSPVSSLLSDLLIVAHDLGNAELEHSVKLELLGYADSNPAYDGDTVPDYRKVRGRYMDQYNRPIHIQDQRLDFLGTVPLPYPVSALEQFTRHVGGELELSDHPGLEFINTHFNIHYPVVIAKSFVFAIAEVDSVLSAIRTQIIDWVQDVRKSLTAPLEYGISSLDGLHPTALAVAKQLYEDGHYRQAILDTYIALVDTVKICSGRGDLDGAPLMDMVFSPKNPIIKLSSNQDEQLGFMMLFKGAVLGIRNPKAHKLIPQTDPQKAFEWLTFASVLFRILDEAQVSGA